MTRTIALIPFALILGALLYAGPSDMQAHHCHGPTPQACARY
jgi:hypothetical protein